MTRVNVGAIFVGAISFGPVPRKMYIGNKYVSCEQVVSHDRSSMASTARRSYGRM